MALPAFRLHPAFRILIGFKASPTEEVNERGPWRVFEMPELRFSFPGGESRPRENVESLRLVPKELRNEPKRCQTWMVPFTEEYP